MSNSDISLLVCPDWKDYELIDSGEGLRLERFGRYIISRPDPQAIWGQKADKSAWSKVDAWYKQENNGKGGWIFNNPLPDRWQIEYKSLKFHAHLTPFKHTGIFPEQSAHWDWMIDKIKSTNRQLNILNLFAYTGGATLACASAGAKVTHVDSSKPSITWARDNQILSGLEQAPIRWIPDDVLKFTTREIKRGVKYDAIIMDPPIYGHGTDGERWDFNTSMPHLINNCKQLLSHDPVFILINAYAISSSSMMLNNLLLGLNLNGNIEYGELALQETNAQRYLSTGIYARWHK